MKTDGWLFAHTTRAVNHRTRGPYGTAGIITPPWVQAGFSDDSVPEY